MLIKYPPQGNSQKLKTFMQMQKVRKNQLTKATKNYKGK